MLVSDRRHFGNSQFGDDQGHKVSEAVRRAEEAPLDRPRTDQQSTHHVSGRADHVSLRVMNSTGLKCEACGCFTKQRKTPTLISRQITIGNFTQHCAKQTMRVYCYCHLDDRSEMLPVRWQARKSTGISPSVLRELLGNTDLHISPCRLSKSTRRSISYEKRLHKPDFFHFATSYTRQILTLCNLCIFRAHFLHIMSDFSPGAWTVRLLLSASAF
jgi:hypothetical protein